MFPECLNGSSPFVVCTEASGGLPESHYGDVSPLCMLDFVNVNVVQCIQVLLSRVCVCVFVCLCLC